MGERKEQDVSVVGRGAHVEGSLVSTGSLWIAGRVTGEISVEGQVTVAPAPFTLLGETTVMFTGVVGVGAWMRTMLAAEGTPLPLTMNSM